ncbi:MAG: NADPH-dependent reductase [Gammaproteobacteria bacterium]|nr:NADPH-dependent reductase [Gammaproteobacteria bacterium]
MKFMLMAASLRKDSVNKKLIKLSAKLLAQQNCAIDLTDFAEFNLPLYNGDIQTQQGIPEVAHVFVQRMQVAQGLIIASPEYNFSTPGVLKNLIDWVSRITPMPWSNQKIYLMSASPSLIGGNRGLWHTRVPLEACGGIVYPNMFSLASAYEAFTETGELKDAKLQERLSNDLAAFVEFSRRLA